MYSHRAGTRKLHDHSLIYDRTHSHATWLIRACDMPHSHAVSESSRMYPCALMYDMTLSHVSWPAHMWHDSLTCSEQVLSRVIAHVALCTHIWYDSFTCVMTRSLTHIWHDSLICAMTRGGGLGSRPKKMYGERLGDGVEYHLMSPTPNR